MLWNILSHFTNPKHLSGNVLHSFSSFLYLHSPLLVMVMGTCNKRMCVYKTPDTWFPIYLDEYLYCLDNGILYENRCLYNPRVYFLAFSHFLKYMIALCKKKLSDNVLFSISSFLYNMVCTISRRNVQYSLGYFNKKSHVFQQILIQSENHASNKGKSYYYYKFYFCRQKWRSKFRVADHTKPNILALYQ